MVHALVYANRERGYGCYERSRGFPARYEEAIERVSGVIGQRLDIDGERVDLRYGPLKDRYLLSVIFRILDGNRDESRPHSIIVHFLMDAGDADRFFRLPFSAGAENARKLAAALLDQCRGQELPDNLDRYLLSGGNGAADAPRRRIWPAVALAGALYGQAKPASSQLFAELKGDAVPEIQALLQDLPPRLRKHISFHTGVLSAEESRGVTVCISPAPKLRNIINKGFDGGEITDKYYCFPDDPNTRTTMDQRAVAKAGNLLKLPEQIPLYGFLQDAIWEWEEYFQLAEVYQKKDPLAAALEVLPQERVIGLLENADSLDMEALNGLEQAAPRRSELRRKVRQLIKLRELEQQPAVPEESGASSEEEKSEKNRRSKKGFRELAAPWECVLCLIGLVLLNFSVVAGVQFVLLDMAGVEQITASMDTILDVLKILGIIIGTLIIGVFGRGAYDKFQKQ